MVPHWQTNGASAKSTVDATWAALSIHQAADFLLIHFHHGDRDIPLAEGGSVSLASRPLRTGVIRCRRHRCSFLTTRSKTTEVDNQFSNDSTVSTLLSTEAASAKRAFEGLARKTAAPSLRFHSQDKNARVPRNHCSSLEWWNWADGDELVRRCWLAEWSAPVLTALSDAQTAETEQHWTKYEIWCVFSSDARPPDWLATIEQRSRQLGLVTLCFGNTNMRWLCIYAWHLHGESVQSLRGWAAVSNEAYLHQQGSQCVCAKDQVKLRPSNWWFSREKINK